MYILLLSACFFTKILYYCMVPILVAPYTSERNHVTAKSIPLRIGDEAVLIRLRALPLSKRQAFLNSAAEDTGIIKRLEMERCRWTSYGALEVPAVLHPRDHFDPPMSPGQYHLMREELIKKTFVTCLRKQFLSVVRS